eukprot:gnl/TRDRNA2_/TRDRNA2_61410_c0_seq1.p1 gnl/TRDRNA2_/TRDRNA2_61410_c0~~gnl/TRDRNA2_/TRDRNA2_61410_c0_seq1.p1  ORF type:complete len:506 (-),score=107.14 gnl/TRDRNA2_/TRDRNA2_61410_c0_seq1:90-1574(-)
MANNAHGSTKADASRRDTVNTDTDDRRSSSIYTDRSMSETCYVNLDRYDDNAMKHLPSWEQLLGVNSTATGSTMSGVQADVCQAVDWYGWQTPTKFQAVAIPCVRQACQNVSGARRYTLLQAASGLGKTSALALSLLVSARREVQQLQFIVAALDALANIEKHLACFGTMSPVQVANFPEPESPDINADIKALNGAQIVLGHPKRLAEVFKQGRDKIALNEVEALLIDDSAEVIVGQWNQSVCDVNKFLSKFATRPLRYIVIGNFIPTEAKPALKALKSSLMSKKNMFDPTQQVSRVMKVVKHYLVRSKPQEWIEQLVKLRQMIFIPRAVIFCDDETRFKAIKSRLEGMRVEGARDREKRHIFGEDTKASTIIASVIDPQTQTPEQRNESLEAFKHGQHDFLFTRSEPNIFQTSLPRVFWILHFGIENTNLSWYGCRLLCMDDSLRQKAAKNVAHDGVSILFTPPEASPGQDQTEPELKKMYGVKFEDLPFYDM